MKKSGSKKKKIALIVIACIVVVLIAGLWIFSVYMYNLNFDRRIESYAPQAYRVEDFEDLHRTGYKFASNKGQQLQGYMYRSGDEQKGIVVLAHGFGGGGQRTYMDCINYFAKNGYYVFAYDATGNDESEGETVGGMPQGVIDLDYAISFVEDNEDFPDLPIVLFGHSWGGYSALNVLTFHPEVKAVVECAGCNKSSDLFEAGGRAIAGPVVYPLMPFIRAHEFFKYGNYSTTSALKAFKKTDAAVMFVHSSDDKTVPIEYGLDLFKKKLGDDPRFVYMRFENKGHGCLNIDTGYNDEFNAQFDEWLKTLDYDYNASENYDRFAADKADYINKNLDRAKWADRLDEEMFAQFVAFYDEHI